MADQPPISNYFKSFKKVNACSQAFRRQYNAIITNTENEISEQNNDENDIYPDCCQHLQEISELKSTAMEMKQENEKLKDTSHADKNQVKILSDKYTQLKTKHIQLLDILMEKEIQIQKLQLIVHENSEQQSRLDGISSNGTYLSIIDKCSSAENVNFNESILLRHKLIFVIAI